jgi:hypothetical protein
MQHKDEWGNPASGATRESLEHYEHALRLFRCYIGDPVAVVDAALRASPGMVMGYALKAYLHLLGTEPSGLPVAADAHAMALRLPANAREAGHLRAIGQLLVGSWRDAARTLEDVSIDSPCDPLALQAGHLIDFLCGDARMLRDRIARALPAWDEHTPGYHAVLGMHAFGLEETGDYAQAEAQGRRGVELEPRDAWSQHAVAHVMEMQCRQKDGIEWMRANVDAWSRDNSFAVHNWWHLALFHLEIGEVDEVLALYDGPIYGARSAVVFDMIDASAMLWRLMLRGIDVGFRWEAVADKWEPLAAAGNYAFNDAHAMMAFIGARRGKAVEALLEAQHAVMDDATDNSVFTREVGHPVALAIRAFGESDYAETVRLLRRVRGIAQRFGGSHAQRDLLDQTLIEAALRSGQNALAAALIAERRALRPTPFTALLEQRLARGAQPRILARAAA